MTAFGQIKRFAKAAINGPGMMSARIRAQTVHAARFSGAFPTREAALAALPDRLQTGYDDRAIVDISFDWMCQRAAWDYPLLYWLKTVLPDGGTVLDAGGHLGTKYIAFRDVMSLDPFEWVVYDLPEVIAAARIRQTQGGIPAQIVFCDHITDLPKADVLIASGFLQYLDTSLSAFLAKLPKPPTYILINKLPLRSGKPIFTIERIGTAKVPYQMRSGECWEAEVADAGYEIADKWDIPELAHVIATHPTLGASESQGFLLVRQDA